MILLELYYLRKQGRNQIKKPLHLRHWWSEADQKKEDRVRGISLDQNQKAERASSSVGFVENLDTCRRTVGSDTKPSKKTLKRRRRKQMQPKQVQQ
jgi:hypothetical protein